MASRAIEETYSWLRAAGFMKGLKMSTEKEWTRLECEQMSRAFSAGDFANAYESTDLEDHEIDEMSEHERAAFVLGFFSSYSLDEIGFDREAFDEAYFSEARRYVVDVAKYCDSRLEEYREDYAAFCAEEDEVCS